MKVLFILGVFFSCVSCEQRDHFNRGYVISKSHLESEPESSEEGEHH